MKTFTCQLLLAIALIGLPFASLKGKALQEQEKKETFVFKSVKKNGLLRLNKDFGNITIVLWDKDEIRVERVQTIAASTAENAKKKLESRMVKQEKGGGVYTLKLECKHTQDNGEYRIEDIWTVYVPKDRLSFDVQNRFGDIIFPDGLKCAGLDSEVSFGTIFIKDVQASEHCTLTVQHGALDVEKANMLTVKTKHSNVKIGQVDELNFSHQFDTVNIDCLKNGSGTSKFTSFTLRTLECKLDLVDCKHDTANIGVGDSRSFEGLTVKAQHSNIHLLLGKKLSARYALQTKFGDVDVQADIHSQHRQKEEWESNFVSMDIGYVGSDANAKAKIDVTTTFSHITMKYM